jgi:DNA (cytosine-5)-methyltransferase 1
MRHASLFSGIGGFDLAAEWMGWENVFHCEWMEFPRKVLDYYWPGADSYTDICKTDFKKYANQIDILTGGFPCQPFSLAGKRKGTDDERYLWGEMLRAVQEIKPTYVIGENVFGIANIDRGLVFEQVCLDLEAEGYEVQPFIIPAAAKNAPHRRDRVWFVAYNHGIIRRERRQFEPREQSRYRESNEDSNTKVNGNATDTNSSGIKTREIGQILEQPHKQREATRFINVTLQGDVMHTNSPIRQREYFRQSGKREFNRPNSRFRIDNFKNFPTESPICGGDDGLPTKLDGITFSKWRAESIKGYGNAIVPQVAYEIFKQLQPTANCDNL